MKDRKYHNIRTKSNSSIRVSNPQRITVKKKSPQLSSAKNSKPNSRRNSETYQGNVVHGRGRTQQVYHAQQAYHAAPVRTQQHVVQQPPAPIIPASAPAIQQPANVYNPIYSFHDMMAQNPYFAHMAGNMGAMGSNYIGTMSMNTGGANVIAPNMGTNMAATNMGVNFGTNIAGTNNIGLSNINMRVPGLPSVLPSSNGLPTAPTNVNGGVAHNTSYAPMSPEAMAAFEAATAMQFGMVYPGYGGSVQMQ